MIHIQVCFLPFRKPLVKMPHLIQINLRLLLRRNNLDFFLLPLISFADLFGVFFLRFSVGTLEGNAGG